jgi:type VI secretion system protein ImpL
MIDAAKRKRKDNGVFELSWDNNGVVVTANLKIVATAPAPAVQAAQPAQGFKRLRLPESIISAAPPPAPSTPQAPAPAPGAPGAPATTPAPAPAAAPSRTAAAATVGAVQ